MTERNKRVRALIESMTSQVAVKQGLARMDGTHLRVVVADEDATAADGIASVFRTAGWDAWTAFDGDSVIKLAHDQEPDVVLLSTDLPGADPFDLLEALRQDTAQVGIVFLASESSPTDRIATINAGADDFLTQPFDVLELLARAHALVRRAGLTRLRDVSTLRVGDLVIDEQAHEVTRGGVPIDLTTTEFELLRYLANNARRVMSKTQILNHVWAYDFGGKGHVVELYISYLRKKIDAGRAPMIHTVRGVGYVLKPR
jgi:two-component system OmpR family response regulator